MPQLTPDFDRVIINVLLSNDVTKYNVLNNTKLALMVSEIRISEDYCHSDVIIIDFANFTLPHVTHVTLTDVKKYELCYLVSAIL
jgi:hypothetical protein